MKGTAQTLSGLLLSTALASVLTAQAANAQEAAANAANAQADQTALLLGDVVVTATRQADTVNRVPLSISAVTQRALDQQGIRNVNDLQRSVPALSVTSVTAGVATFSIRGIVSAGGATTPTTGVYIDDVPLQKRSTQGVVQNNGTPSPPLFDLERIEVLRGPQGTLFGGSSMGGTIRFIQPQPSLTRWSANVRLEASDTKYGSESYEGGVAFGGPIVQDKLGFRITAFNRHTGGYVDLVDPYTLRVKFKDANSSNNYSYRAALAFQPTERMRATLSYYITRTSVADGTDSYQKPLNRQITTPSYCFNVPGPTTIFPSTTPAPIPCPATAVPGQTVGNVYMRPAQTYGPFNFGPFQNFGQNDTKSSTVTNFATSSLTLDYDFDKMSVKSITSYLQDQTTSLSYEAAQVTNASGYADRNGNFYAPGSTLAFNGTTANITSSSPFLPGFPNYAGPFRSKNNRWGVIQEIRFSSTGDPKPFSWVAGVYYSNIRGNTYYELSEDVDRINNLLFGSTARYSQLIPLPAGQTCANLNLPAGSRTLNTAGACRVGIGVLPGGLFAIRDQRVKDTEIAAFGEGNYWVTDKLKLTAGVRLSRVSFDYRQINYGAIAGWLNPTVENTGITTGNPSESPVTPKVGAQYQLNENDLIYVNAAKGFRAGGVNVPLPESQCGAGLALIGLTTRDAPGSFNSDSVWSYEAGGKFRIANRIQVNASAYRVDWSNVQLTVSIPGCGPTFIQNAGAARSQGVDLQAQGRIVGALTANFAFGYTDAEYTSTATGPKPANGSAATPVVQKGDKLPVPDWTTSIGLQYDFTLFQGSSSYIRADWQHSSKYTAGLGPGVNAYAPDTRFRPPTDVVNARIGLSFKSFDMNLFANNLLNSKDPLSQTGGRSGCTPNTDAACATFSTYSAFTAVTTFRPRTVGIQLNYRY
jgi:outer membrane receptor protein involved in Fe transport